MQAKLQASYARSRVGFKQRIGFYDNYEYNTNSRLAADECDGDNIHMPTYPGTNSTKLHFTVTDRNHGVNKVATIDYRYTQKVGFAVGAQRTV